MYKVLFIMNGGSTSVFQFEALDQVSNAVSACSSLRGYRCWKVDKRRRKQDNKDKNKKPERKYEQG